MNLWVGISMLAAMLAGASAVAVRADVITEWNEVLLDAIRADATPPPKASRAMAMVHAAMYDAVIAVEGGFEPYHVAMTAAEETSAEAAAVAAAHGVLVALYPDQAGVFDAALDISLGALADGASKTAGVGLGESVAEAILEFRAEDGSGDAVEYEVGMEPGDWQPTPPGFAAALLPQWPDVEPFCMSSGSQYRRTGPPPLDSVEFATSFNEVKALGSVNSTTRTADQTEIATFWADGAGTATPPGHWNAIAQIIAEQEGNTLVANARLFALLNLALADAAIVAWDNKYAFDDWRPVTAIRAAETDGNDATEADPEWTSLITTPPFPSYTSGHSTFSGAGSKMIELFYGRDMISFDTTSDAMPGVVRSFTQLSQAANEAGRSRVYGGIHWEYDNQDGLGSGRELAVQVYNNFLKPVSRQPDDDAPPVVPSLCGALGMLPMTVVGMGLLGMRRCLVRKRPVRR